MPRLEIHATAGMQSIMILNDAMRSNGMNVKMMSKAS